MKGARRNCARLQMRKAAVEPTWLLIVGAIGDEAANDKKQLLPMVELIEQQSGSVRKQFLADNGILFGGEPGFLGIERSAGAKIEGFIATGKQKQW